MKKTKWQVLWHQIKANRIFYLMMLPFLIFFVTFAVYPVLKAIFYSFTDYNILEKPDFIGLKNYAQLILHDQIFIKAVQNTFIIALFVGPFGYILSFLVAWLINELPHMLGTIVTIIFYTPSMAGGAMVIFQLLFANDSNGYVNGWLLKYGFIDSPIYWLSDSKTILPLVIIISVWMSLGVGFLSFVAGIKNVQEDQYEAAAIDGIKNRWQELWFITLPNMKPQLLFGAVMSITGSFSVGGVADALVGFPSPSYASHTIVNHLNDYGLIRLEMGRASAIAVILFFIMIVSNLLVQKLLRKVGT
ncbi:MAG: sugar ABC transporter permease [Lachnospiraceae bacterium]|jgi:multiple sugar transport system permease protein|nr:sugar ABC transporter permease [Lachnospiraceae bacterium]MBP5248844.1 sugar ABC transporter permease [Lachnospiraceae bacterium]